MGRVLTDREVAHEVAMIKDESQWPQWPWLPLKNVHRHDGEWADENDGLGMLLSPAWREAYLEQRGLSEPVVQVLLINMLNLGKALEERRADIPHQDFESIEALVRAGWIGD